MDIIIIAFMVGLAIGIYIVSQISEWIDKNINK
mgnify:CR=1 FL=1